VTNLLRRRADLIAALVLVYAALGFGYPGIMYLLFPVKMGASWDFAPTSAFAVSNIRLGFGAFHLGVAVMALLALAAKQFRFGLLTVAVFAVLAVATRAFGLAVDGIHPRSLLVLSGEAVSTTIFLIGLFIHTRFGETRGVVK
jgi:hypothetical protein